MKNYHKWEILMESLAKLQEKYLEAYIPVWDEETGTWCCSTEHGFECGDIGYVADIFSGTGLIYHLLKDGKMDHVHNFDAVISAVLIEPDKTDIVTEYGEYSQQEINMIKGIKQAISFVKSKQRPMTREELRENRLKYR